MSKKRQVILKRALAILFDVMLLYICLFVAGILRGILSDGYTREAAVRLWAYSPLFVGMYIAALSLAGIYSVTWKYADLRDYPGEVGLEAFKAALRKLVNPKPRAHQHLESAPPPLSEMPDTTGDEIPAEALKFATFLKFDAPKKKSHPSRGNIH